ncbi:hypothetical protein [Schlesneria sp. DSM 10557]|uniref:hypothetical protein n=1 Tax=Schlesneria sp. DSM 10557 TaxID=3044399 RepID=UPI0035A16D4E
MNLRQLIEQLQSIETKAGGDLKVELVTGHRCDEYEMVMEDTSSVELIDDHESTFVRIRAAEVRAWY